LLLAQILQFEKVDQLLGAGSVRHLFPLRQAPINEDARTPAFIRTWRPSMMLSSTVMPPNSAMF